MGFQDALLVSFDEKSAAFNDGSLCALFRFTEKASQVAIMTATAKRMARIEGMKSFLWNLAALLITLTVYSNLLSFNDY